MNTSGRMNAGTGMGTGTGRHRAAEEAVVVGGAVGPGGTTGLTGGGVGTGGGLGTGGGMGTGAGLGATGAGVGTGGAAATVRPSAGQRLVGEAEKLTGHIVGNPTMVVRGQEKKTGMPAAVSNTGGVGNSNAAAGPGLGGALGARGTY